MTPRLVAFPTDPRRAQKVRLTTKPTAPPFANVICGDPEAARQASALSGPDAALRSLPSNRLLAETADRDLLAIDCHGGSQPSGTMLSGVASELAHRATVPLLIARRSPEGDGEFPRAVLLTSDGSPGSWAAMRLAARIARLRGSDLRVVYVPDGHPERYRELFKQVNEVERLTGATPAFLDAPGDSARRIVETARASRSSLVAIGKCGLNGAKSLGSVSERVLQRAPCSVLLVPPGSGRRGDREARP
jgi:nucleotide-binding universal stress UspA family protein